MDLQVISDLIKKPQAATFQEPRSHIYTCIYILAQTHRPGELSEMLQLIEYIAKWGCVTESQS